MEIKPIKEEFKAKAETVMGHCSFGPCVDPYSEHVKEAMSEQAIPELGIELCRECAVLPVISEGNAGIDLRLLTENGDPVIIEPHSVHKFYTGLKMDIPSGYYIEVVPRSSAGVKKTLRLLNTVAVLDESWKGETLIFLENFGNSPVEIQNNERICQMILHKVHNVKIKQVSKVGISERGENGFGSSGRM